jgi:hypothetical protein
MRLSKTDNGAMTLAVDTAITILEADYDLPPGIRKIDVQHALIMLRNLRSKLLREGADLAGAGASTTSGQG